MALENTFSTVGQSMLQLAMAQGQTNRHLQQHLKQGHAMAYFGLLHRSYDTEVICIYIMEPVFYCLLLIIVLCDLYFDGHILLC